MKFLSLLAIILLAGLISIFSTSAINAENGYGYNFRPEIIEALNAHDTAQVLTGLEDVISTDPGFAPNYLLQGKIYFERGQYDQAMKSFKTALKKKSSLYEALYYKGMTLVRQGNFKEAKKDFEKGIKKAKNSELALFHNGLGLLLLEEGQKADSVALFSQADIEFRKAISLDSTKSEYHVNLGDANYFAKIYPLAINEYNRVIETDTTNLVVFFRLARAYVAQSQFNQALEQLRTVLVRDSMYAGAWKEAGKLYTMAGLSARDNETKQQRFIEAIGSYKKYIELSHDSADGEIFFNIGRSYFNLGGYAQADSALSYVLTQGDVPRNIYLYLGRAKIGLEDYLAGIDYLKKHLAWLQEEDPDWVPGAEEADLYRRMGDAYKAMGNNAEAAENYITAAELDPASGRYSIEAALALHQIQDFERALEFYQNRIEIGPDQWNVYLNAAFCTLRLEQYEQAIDYLLKVVELDSANVKAHELLSNTYLYQLQDCENGIRWTQAAYSLDSGNCDLLKSMGYAYFSGTCPTNYGRSISYFKKALDCYKSKGVDACGNTDLILYIAQAYHLNAVELSEANKDADSKANFKNAHEWYKKVVKCDPGNKDAKQGIRDVEFEY